MKITFILPGYALKPSGGCRVVYEYANHLVERGHNVTVVHSYFLKNTNLRPYLYRLLRKKTRYLATLPISPKNWWQPIDKRVKMLYIPEPIDRYIPDADLIFATAWQTADYVINYPISKGTKCYLIMDFDHYFGPEEKLIETWKMPFKKITISQWLYEKVAGVAGTEDLLNIPIGINFNRFRKIEEIENRPKRVAMIYSSKKYKRSEDACEAIKISKSRHPDLQAKIIGQGSRPPQIAPWIDFRLNISDNELVKIYNNSKIFVCSSLAEGFGLPAAEAMACGCALASTDCGGNREYAENEITALLSPPKDPNALAKNVIRLLEDDCLRKKLAEAGYERIQSFTWKKSTECMEKFLNNFIV